MEKGTCMKNTIAKKSGNQEVEENMKLYQDLVGQMVSYKWQWITGELNLKHLSVVNCE